VSRDIIIGDLHGCLEETKALLDKCKVMPGDRIFFVGDLVDRGPNSAGCVDLVMEIEKKQGIRSCVLGNHESKHIEHEHEFRNTNTFSRPLPHTHVVTRGQLRPEHYAWFESMPLYIRLPEHNAIIVHAGVFPYVPIEAQNSHHLLHIQSICPWNTDDYGNIAWNTTTLWPSKVPANERDRWMFWTNFWNGPELVVFGHSVFDRPLVTEHLAGIDGGAVFGMKLHAFVLPERTMFQRSANVRCFTFLHATY
jgi:hypothetical protein